MQNTIAKYILLLFFTVFIVNTAVTALAKNYNFKIACVHSETDDSNSDDVSDNDPDMKKLQKDSNTLTLDDDVFHEFHFHPYYEYSKRLKYGMSVPSLPDRIITGIFLPPRS